MTSKNIFSISLQHLIQQAGITSTMISQAVQYDISYISKWLSGKMLPSEKNIESIIISITTCIITSAQKDNLHALLSEYHCKDAQNLHDTLQNTLRDAYWQSKKYPKSVALPDSNYHPYISASELAHLIKKQSGNRKAAVIDLLSLNHEARLLLAEIRDGHFSLSHTDLSDHYTMVINIDELPGDNGRDCVYDSIFLIHMLTSFSSIDFQLYNHPQASGKFLYAIDNCYSVTGMVFQGDTQCFAVNERSDSSTACALYQKALLLATQEQLIFRKTTMEDMIHNCEYIRSMISTNIKWLLGHATELILSDDLFDELLTCINTQDKDELHKLHHLAQNVIRQPGTRIMVYESALSDLVVSGELDFFNNRVVLTPAQRIRYLAYMLSVLNTSDILFKLVDGCFSTDFQYITNPCLFLSDSLCYLRLENGRYCDNLLVLNDKSVKEMFEQFYEKIWNKRQDVVIETRSEVINKILHYKASADLIAKME